MSLEVIVERMILQDRKYRVLVLCTGNSARSIMGEALFNELGKGKFIAYSAGSKPVGRVNPYAIELLKNQGFKTEGLRSKGWDEFTGSGAPELDFIITVCDNAAGETCPVWPGQPATAHWGIPDPATVVGDDAAKRAAFRKASEQLARRIQLFMSLPVSSLDRLTIKEKLTEIGKLLD